MEFGIWNFELSKGVSNSGRAHTLGSRIPSILMKSAPEREQLIKDINVLLNQAYDSTLDEIYTVLKRIDDLEDEEDLKAIKEAREDVRINSAVSWDEIQNEIKKDVT